MARLESLSPLVVAWAVALGFGGLLLVMSLMTDPVGHGGPQPAGTAANVIPEPRGAIPPSGSSPAAKPEAGPMRGDAPPVPPPTVVVTPPMAETGDAEPGNGEAVAATPQRPVKPTSPDRDARKPEPCPSRPIASSPDEKPSGKKPPKSKPAKSALQIRESLRQPVRSFSQEQPVAARELLREIEELAGVELRLAKGLASDPRLARKVKLDLRQTTIDGILGALLKEVGLAHKVHDGYVLVTEGAAS